jgi:dienelactone hydrolase
MVMHELPGFTPQAIGFAFRLAAAGYSAYLPLLFGEPGHRLSRFAQARVCLRREIGAFAAHRTSRLASRMRRLCAEIHRRTEAEGRPAAGVGAIGMCLTGGWVLATLAEPAVVAGVLAQPAIPIATWPGRERKKAALGIAPEDLDAAAGRRLPLLALRFSNDRLCPAERFAALEKRFAVDTHSIPTPDERWGLEADAHSVLTDEYTKMAERERKEKLAPHPRHPVRLAFGRLTDYLNERFEAAERGGRED